MRRAAGSPSIAIFGALAVSLVTAACGGYSGPPDIETAREGIRPEYRIVYDGEDGKTVLELLESGQVVALTINGVPHEWSGLLAPQRRTKPGPLAGTLMKPTSDEVGLGEAPKSNVVTPVPEYQAVPPSKG